MLNVVKIVHGIMCANKRIPVSEDTWRELARIKEAGQTYDKLLRELIEERKEKRLEEDVAEWEKDESFEFIFHQVTCTGSRYEDPILAFRAASDALCADPAGRKTLYRQALHVILKPVRFPSIRRYQIPTALRRIKKILNMFNHIRNMQAGDVIGVKITRREKEEIQRLIDAGAYLSFSDFLRSAVRDKLREIRVTKVRDVDREEAKKEITGYYRRYGEAYPSDVAEDLELDYDIVFELTEELRREGMLE